MLRKTMFAAAAVAAAAFAYPTAPANADASFNIIIGPGGGVGVGIGNGGGGHGNSRVSCNRARRILRNEYDFHDISTIDCQGDSYKFNAWRYGSKWRVKLNAWTGEVTSMRQLH